MSALPGLSGRSFERIPGQIGARTGHPLVDAKAAGWAQSELVACLEILGSRRDPEDIGRL